MLYPIELRVLLLCGNGGFSGIQRHQSSRYYARLSAKGKEIWKAPERPIFSVAEMKLAEAKKEHRATRTKNVAPRRSQDEVLSDDTAAHAQAYGEGGLKERDRLRALPLSPLCSSAGRSRFLFVFAPALLR
jgi:hypothetical protein